VADLANVTDSQLQRWNLRRDGEPTHGAGSMVSPVRTAEGVPALLKIGPPDADSEHEHLALRRWGGEGAVRLLSADPPRRALLLERLHPQTLDTLTDTDACEVIAGLYRRLHVPAIPQLRTLTSHLEKWASEFHALPRSAAMPHRLVEQAIALSRDLVADPLTTGHLVHTNLHYGNVLAADREPWLAIAPRPINGDPHFEVAPMLWNRWDELRGHIRGGVQRRFYALVDAAELDEGRARAWVVIRVVREAIRDPAQLTKYVALAKAVQN
jgi:streptomycin 6-kinase